MFVVQANCKLIELTDCVPFPLTILKFTKLHPVEKKNKKWSLWNEKQQAIFGDGRSFCFYC